MDYTRLAQWGSWDGWIEVDGARTEIAHEHVGFTRPLVGDPWRRRAGARRAGPVAPQFYWLWAPCNFDDVCTHFDVNESGDGQQWHHSGFVIPVLGDARLRPGARHRRAGGVGRTDGERRLQDRLGARHAPRRARHDRDDAVEREPRSRSTSSRSSTFQMMGIGYFHPEWAHGVWKGDLAVGGERWNTAELEPLAIQNVHIQALCRARLTGSGEERVGIGILEQLVLGVHEPSGFTGLLDGAP